MIRLLSSRSERVSRLTANAEMAALRTDSASQLYAEAVDSPMVRPTGAHSPLPYLAYRRGNPLCLQAPRNASASEAAASITHIIASARASASRIR